MVIPVQNKKYSDNKGTDEILRLQGVSWLKRTAISAGTVWLAAKHYKDEAGVEHIDIDQTLSGMSGTHEGRVLDWSPRERSDHVFGNVVAKSRRVPVAEIEEAYLKEGWTEDTVEHGAVQSYAESDTPKSKTTWIADQVYLRLPRALALTVSDGCRPDLGF